jgi:hypothetical protein
MIPETLLKLRFGFGLFLVMPIYMGVYIISHSIPFNTYVFKNKKEILHAFISCFSMIGWIYFLLKNFDFLTLIDAYLIPCLVFGYWLFIVNKKY